MGHSAPALPAHQPSAAAEIPGRVFASSALTQPPGVADVLPDQSRLLLTITAYQRVTVGDVVANFTDTAATYGLPAATLTDNGSVYTSRFTHGHNDFERLIASLGVTQRNGHPGHPQTQGKIERFHRTLKLWLIGRRRPSTITEAQTQLDDFRVIYNTQRPHRAHHPRATPQSAYLARPKATPAQATEHFRIRHDIVDQFGKSPCATAAACTTSASADATPPPRY